MLGLSYGVVAKNYMYLLVRKRALKGESGGETLYCLACLYVVYMLQYDCLSRDFAKSLKETLRKMKRLSPRHFSNFMNSQKISGILRNT